MLLKFGGGNTSGRTECPNEGCTESLLPRALAKHQDSCEYRLIDCKHCANKMACLEMEEHVQKCPKVKIECPNKGCDVQWARGAMQVHRARCENEEVGCPCPGCEEGGKRSEVAAHLKDRHMEAAVDLLQDAYERIAELEDRVAAMGGTV